MSTLKAIVGSAIFLREWFVVGRTSDDARKVARDVVAASAPIIDPVDDAIDQIKAERSKEREDRDRQKQAVREAMGGDPKPTPSEPLDGPPGDVLDVEGVDITDSPHKCR